MPPELRLQFRFGMAGFKGSEGEVLNHFIDAVDSGYLSKEEFPQYEHAAKKALWHSWHQSTVRTLGTVRTVRTFGAPYT